MSLIRHGRTPSLLLLACCLITSRAGAGDWPEAERFEQFLRRALVTDSSPIGAGVTKSLKLRLELDGESREAVFKSYDQPSDSWRREIAAYQLDRLLGLGMVPPTVKRKHRGRLGGLQLWVEGSSVASAEVPHDVDAWRRQVSEMWIFDYLIGNIDRHLENAIMTPEQHLVLIDNSKAFQTYPQVLDSIDSAVGATRASFWMIDHDSSRTRYPTFYRQELVDRIRSLTRSDLKTAIGSWVDGPSRRSLLERRDEILQVLARRSTD